MKNKSRKEIEALEKQIRPLQQCIYDINEAEVLAHQRPRLNRMVGLCLRSNYEPKTYYAKVIDLIESKKGSPNFILEIVHITKEGNPYMHLDNASPYLNKEWWDAPFPVAGWDVCSEAEYEAFKAKIVSELHTQKRLRAWIKKLDF